MKKVLVVIGTGGSFDTVDLPPALREKGIECTEVRLSAIAAQPGQYDAAVLLGLTGRRDTAYEYASRVRTAIGPDAEFLVVSSWNASAMAQPMKEKYGAEYLGRNGSILNLVAAVLDLFEEAKTAPS